MYDEKVVKDLITPKLYKKSIFPSCSEQFKFAAVMITIHFTNKNPHVILIKRTNHVKSHAGEISFPGGNFMEKDVEMLETAVREASEEIGINLEKEDVIGCLDVERTLTSCYIIYPYVALVDRIPKLTNTNYEVEKIIDAPLIPLLRSRENDVMHQQQFSIPQLPKFTIKDDVIWGATARILDQLAKIFSREINYRKVKTTD